MGYYYTTTPENAVPGKSRGMPKTHTPGSPVKERGARFYMPEVGRWCNRDPLGEKGGLLLYMFCGNHPPNSIDPYGLWWTWEQWKEWFLFLFHRCPGGEFVEGAHCTPDLAKIALIMKKREQCEAEKDEDKRWKCYEELDALKSKLDGQSCKCKCESK